MQDDTNNTNTTPIQTKMEFPLVFENNNNFILNKSKKHSKISYFSTVDFEPKTRDNPIIEIKCEKQILLINQLLKKRKNQSQSNSTQSKKSTKRT